MKKRIYLLMVLLIAIGLIISGCGSKTSSPGGASASTGFADKPEFTWRMQVIHNPGQSDFEQHVKTAEEIYEATNGRLKIEVQPNGTFVSSMEGFQAAGDGVFEMHASWPVYARGIEYALLPLSTGNLTMDASDKYVWLYEHGGQEIMQKAFDKLNLEFIAAEIWGTEVLQANEPFKNMQEMEGKTFRTSDPRLLERNGVAAITLPLEEVFTGLATGAVDVAEFGNLDYNVGLGLTDVTKYSIWPDFWNVHFVTTVVVNKDAWNQLPVDLQKIVELAYKANEFQHFTKSQYRSAVAMKELEESGKMNFVRMDEDQWVELRQQMYQIELEDIKEYGGLTEEALNSTHEFMELWYPYKDISRWWGWGLTPEEMMGFEPKK
ncbi:MAG: TRAP transporter substrate-binding protein DctP [Bacillota bacterium]|nr:TRAP transporter substrate-binding protein DctP [Bacillota bacterium]